MSKSMVVLVFAVAPARAQVDSSAPRVLGHVAWSSAAASARALARFYGELLDLPPRLADERFLLERVRAEYALLASDAVAVNRPLGAAFVASDSGSIERVEFGIARDPALEVGQGCLRRGEWNFGTADDRIVAALEPIVSELEFERDGQRVDLLVDIDVSAMESTALPGWRALGSLALHFIDDADPRAVWLADSITASEAVPRELARCGLAVRIGAENVYLTLDVSPVARSRLADQLQRARPVLREEFALPTGFEGGVARIGLDPERLSEWFHSPSPSRFTPHDDASPPPCELRWLRGLSSDVFAIVPRAGEPPVVFGDPALVAAEDWTPLVKNDLAPEMAGISDDEGDRIAVGAIAFDRAAPACPLTAWRRGEILVVTGDFPIVGLRGLVPRVGR